MEGGRKPVNYLGGDGECLGEVFLRLSPQESSLVPQKQLFVCQGLGECLRG